MFQRDAPRVSSLVTFTGRLICISCSKHCFHGKSGSLESSRVEQAEYFLFSAAHPIKHYMSVFFHWLFFFFKQKMGQLPICSMQLPKKKFLTRNSNSFCITIKTMLLNIFVNWNILKWKIFQSSKELQTLWKGYFKNTNHCMPLLNFHIHSHILGGN